MGFFTSTKDLNVYPMSRQDRRALGHSAFGQLTGLYQSDPGRFWGQGLPDWSGQNLGPNFFGEQGGLTFNDLMGYGPGGGGGGGGGGVSWSGASSGGGPVNFDWTREEYLTRPSQFLEESVLSKGKELLGAQTGNAIRSLQDRLAQTGGDASSPQQMYMQAMLRRQQNQGLADAYRDFETDFTQQALGRRHQAYSMERQLEESSKQRAMQASIANAQGRLSAAEHNSGLAAAAAQADAARRAGASQMLLGLWDKNQDRDMQRYGMLNDMNMGWQRPIGQKTQTPGWGSQLLGGLSSGLSMLSGFGGLGGIQGMLGMGGGAGKAAGGMLGGGAPGPWSGGYGFPGGGGGGSYGILSNNPYLSFLDR